MIPPFNFQTWINEHRHLLKPPVGNQVVFENTEFIIMVVGGPNSRQDYHINESEEFFYQLEGDMTLRILEAGQPKDLPIRQGDIFLLPPNIPHSPQRPAGTVGLVVERRRHEKERDGFLWICSQCHHKLHTEFLFVTDIVKQLPPIFDRFYNSEEFTTCKKCGNRAKR